MLIILNMYKQWKVDFYNNYLEYLKYILQLVFEQWIKYLSWLKTEILF